MSIATKSSLTFLSDQETKVDLLNNEAIAATILRLVKNKPYHPITIGVHGDWGAGKSSILEMIEGQLQEDKNFICLKFNGWQFQGFEDAKIALIEGVVSGLIEKRSLASKAADAVKDVYNSIDKLKAAKVAGKIGISAVIGLPVFGFPEIFDAIKDKIGETITDEDERNATIKEVGEIWKKDGGIKKPNIPHEISGFRKSFSELIKKAEVDRIVVLVDDLDRCLPETAIETLEAIRLFVLLEKTAFIVGADERMIEYAVGRHFPNLPEMKDSQGYARAYLEKLLQVPFRIPSLGETETRIYVTLLLLGAALGEDDEKFNLILELGRKALSTPWDSVGIKSADVSAILGELHKDVLLTAERISPILAAGTRGNPRQIKRFLNALNLRLAVAGARKFGNAIEPTHLAKLMLAELYLPENVFSQIAALVAAAPDGTCQEVADLEALANKGEQTTSVQDESTDEEVDEIKMKIALKRRKACWPIGRHVQKSSIGHEFSRA